MPVWLKAGNRVLLTSRPYGLDSYGLRRLGLPQAPLEPLPEPLQQRHQSPSFSRRVGMMRAMGRSCFTTTSPAARVPLLILRLGPREEDQR